MVLDFKMSENQISQIAKMLYLNLEDIKKDIKTYQGEYNEFLKKEEQNQDTEDENFASNNCEYRQYTDDTICRINIDKNYMKGSNLNGEL